MRHLYGLLILGLVLLSSCIGDDFVDDRVDTVIRILNPIDSLAIDSSYQFRMSFLNNVGKEEQVDAIWTSSSEDVISISNSGFATALQAGSSEVKVEFKNDDGLVEDFIQIGVGERTVETEVTGKKGTVNTSSSYELTGEFTLTELDESGVKLTFGNDYKASTALPGLYVYLSNNPSTIADALEIQAVEVFTGAHFYSIPNVGLEDYKYVLYFCKPFNVKVGHGEIID